MEKRRLEELAVSMGTPFYVFDTDILRERIAWVSDRIRPAKLCYAIKANPFLIRAMDAHVERYEVCSPGEFHICVQNQMNMKKVVLSGVYKEYGDVRYAMEQGVVHYTAESKSQFELVHRCARELGKKAEILLRVTSGNQFGMSEEDVRELLRNRSSCPELQIMGLQYFTGTQKKVIGKIARELEYIEDFIDRLQQEEQFMTRELEFGPGLGVPYFTKDDACEDQKLLEDFAKLLERERSYELIFEMGRFLTASCGCYITRVVDQKRNDAVNACIVDGGIHHVNYYGQNMAMKTPVLTYLPQHPIEQEGEELWTIYGALCTVSDVLLKKFPLKDVRTGDYLVFQNIGAYSVTEGIYLFLSRKMPKIYLYDQKNCLRLLREDLETWNLNTWSEA